MRKSLYLKDDDYRLSFLYGNFTTLTRFTEADLERVITEQLGPLYVSIHATDPELRARLLRNRRGATSLRWLAALLDAGIEVHGQVVVCPGINDGDALDDTLLGVLDRFPRLATVGVVPLGVSDHTTEPDMRAAHARRGRAGGRHRRGLAGALHARARSPARVRVRRVLPPRRSRRSRRSTPTTSCPQHENGIGMARQFEAEVRAALRRHGRRRRRPRHARGLLRLGRRRARRGLPRATRADVVDAGRAPVAPSPTPRCPSRIVTGEYGAQVLAPLADDLADAARRARPPGPVDNRFFGGNIARHRPAHRRRRRRARSTREPRRASAYLLPDVVLSNGRFLDGTTPDDLPRPVEIVATDGASLVAARAPVDERRERARRRRRRPPERRASPRSSTASSAAATRSSRRSPASPATARSSQAEWNGRTFIVVDTGGWLAPDSGDGAEPLARRSAGRPSARSPTPT